MPCSCNKHCFQISLFWIFVGLVSVYILYSGLGVPVQVNNHRLRYNPLVQFEMFELDINDWYDKNMAQEGISILTYQQQVPLDYQYLLGTFIDNFTLDNDTYPDDLISMTWGNFTHFIDQQDISELFITMWSRTTCNNSLPICFENHFPTSSIYYYTNITKEWHFNINSKSISNAIDDPKDGITFIVLISLVVILVLLLSSIPEFGDSSFFFMVLIFIGAYCLWIFTLTVIPIQFSMPWDRDDLDYWTEIKYSLTYTIGNYNPHWWVTGVMLHGIWMYTLLLFLPLMCCFFMLLVACAECCFAFCCEEKADDVGLYIMLLLITIGLCGLGLMTVGFIVLFIGNLTMWNKNTYNGFDDKFMACLFVSLICIWIIYPIFGIMTTLYGNKRDNGKTDEFSRYNSVSKNVKKFRPFFKNKVKNGTDGYDNDGTEQETLAMTGTNRHKQKNVHVVPN